MSTLANSSFEFLQVTAPDADGIALVTMNRPEELNALAGHGSCHSKCSPAWGLVFDKPNQGDNKKT